MGRVLTVTNGVAVALVSGVVGMVARARAIAFHLLLLSEHSGSQHFVRINTGAVMAFIHRNLCG